MREATRRDLLTTAALASVAATVATVPAALLAAEEPDLHLAWGAEADRLAALVYAPGDLDDAAYDALTGSLWDLRERICATPARTLAGVREQVRAACAVIGADEPGSDALLESLALRNVRATLERLSGRA